MDDVLPGTHLSFGSLVLRRHQEEGNPGVVEHLREAFLDAQPGGRLAVKDLPLKALIGEPNAEAEVLSRLPAVPDKDLAAQLNHHHLRVRGDRLKVPSQLPADLSQPPCDLVGRPYVHRFSDHALVAGYLPAALCGLHVPDSELPAGAVYKR